MGELLPVTTLPADVRADGAHGRRLYAAALGFEQQLVRSLTAQLAAMAKPADDGSGDGEDSGGDAASSLIGDQLPDALASGIESAGGIGLAHDLYTAMRAQGR